MWTGLAQRQPSCSLKIVGFAQVVVNYVNDLTLKTEVDIPLRAFFLTYDSANLRPDILDAGQQFLHLWIAFSSG